MRGSGLRAFVVAMAAALWACGGGGGGGSGTSAPTGLVYSDPAPVYGLCGAIPPNVPSTSGGPPASFSVQPALPAGLALDPQTGVLSGAPTVAIAPTPFLVRATNSAGGTATQLVIEVVVADPQGLGYGALGASFAIGLATVREPELASGVANAWSVVAGALPAGIELDPGTGALSGAPPAGTAPDSSDVTIRAENTCTGASASAVVTVTIRPPWPRAAYVVHEAEPVLSTFVPERATGLLRPHGWIEGADMTPAEIASSPDGKWLFVAEGDTTSVRTYALSPVDGRPSETAHSATTGAMPPIDLAVHPSGRALYAITAEPAVAQLSIAADGRLTPLPGAPPAGAEPSNVVVDPLGRAAWVTNSADATISGYAADPSDGSLTHVADVATGATPIGAAATPDGAWVYVACFEGASISIFAVQPGGSLAPAGSRPTAAGSSPSSLVVDPTGEFLYVAHAFEAALEQFAISGGTGALSPLSPASVALPEPATRLDIDPEGGSVYVLSARNGWAVYAPAPDGRLIDTPVGTVTGRGNARAIAFQPGSAPLEVRADAAYAAGAAGEVFQFALDDEGALAPLAPPSVAGAGEGARWIEPHPTTPFVFVASDNPSGDRALARFDVAPGGELELDASFGSQTGGRSLQLDPSGRFAYQVLDGPEGRIRAFRVGGDGSLTQTSTLLGLSAGLRPMAIHPGGRFAYVPSFDGDALETLEIDWASGALVWLSTFLTGDAPSQAAIPESGTHLLLLESASSTLVVYRIHAVDGSLQVLPGGFNDLGSGVSAFAIDPIGEHVFASGVGGSLLRAFRLDAQNGALNATGDEIAAEPAGMLRLSPDGRDVYAVSPGGTLERYGFDPATGFSPGESLPAGASPAGLALRVGVR